MLDNVTVAIFTKLNALAERHGLKPYDLRFARIRGCFWESTRDLFIQVRWQIP